MIPNVLDKGVCRQWFGKVITLGDLAAPTAYHGQRFRRFHALGDHLVIQLGGQAYRAGSLASGREPGCGDAEGGYFQNGSYCLKNKIIAAWKS